MGLSTSELYLVLRARDEASRVLRSFGNEFSNLDAKSAASARRQISAGAAMTTVGVGMVAAGVAGVMAFNRMIDAAQSYNEQVARTQTQVDGVNVTFQQLSDMGLQVGRTVPVAFEQIQPALYDIFSSIDVNAPQAKILLQGIAEAAVGGAVSMETAGRATIAVLNAYKMPATEVNKVNDIMFQLVRKGVGTYEQFTSVIGRSIPSAIRAGQSFQTLAGMMAFMTRNGMSAAQATASSSRALDALSNPKTIAKFKDWGVAIVDNKGHFRDLTDIIADMNKKMEGLSKPEKSAILQNLFKGSGGSAQAMRFFNLALNDTNHLLPEMVNDMNHANGAAAQAYKIMSNTPQAKVQLLKNEYQAMAITVGDQLLPIKLKLLEALTKLLDMWNNLSPSTQRTIVIFLAIASAASVLLGIILIVAGAFVMLAGAGALIGLTFGATLVVVGLVIGIIIGLIYAIYEVVTEHDKMKREVIAAWNWIRTGVENVGGAIKNWIVNTWHAISADTQQRWAEITKWVSTEVTNIWNWIVNTWNTILTDTETIWNEIIDWFVQTWNTITTDLTNAWTAVVNWLSQTWNTIKTDVTNVWNDIVSFLAGVWNSIVAGIDTGINWIENAIATGMRMVYVVWLSIWGVLKAPVDAFFYMLGQAVNLGLAALQFVFEWTMRGIYNAWQAIWGLITAYVIPPLERIYNAVVAAFTRVYDGTVRTFTNVYNFWRGVWNNIYAHVVSVLSAIGSFVERTLTSLENWWHSTWQTVSNWAISTWNTIYNYVSQKVSQTATYVNNKVTELSNWWNRTWNSIKSTTSSTWDSIYSTISRWVSEAYNYVAQRISAMLHTLDADWNSIKNGVISAWNSIVNFLKGIWNSIVGTTTSGVNRTTTSVSSIKSRVMGIFSDVGSWLYSAGARLIQGLINGITSMFTGIGNAMGNLASIIKSHLPGSPVKTGPLTSWNNGGAGKRLVRMIADGLQYTGPAEDAMAELARRMNAKAFVTLSSMGITPGGPVVGGRPGPGGPGSPGYPGGPGSQPPTVIFQEGAIQTQEINPAKHAADLGYEVAKRIGG